MLRFAEINTHFDFHGNLGWLALAIIVFSTWIWYTHRRAKQAPTPLHGLGVLWMLRGVSALLLLLLFFAPEMRISYSESREKSVLFLVDNSASLPLAWNSDWSDVRNDVERFIATLKNTYTVRMTAMSNQSHNEFREFTDFTFDGESSLFPAKFPGGDLDQTAVVIALTDGQFNVGPSPLDVEWLGKMPVFPYLPAEPKSPEGLQIVELIAPEYIAVTDSVPFQLTWRSMGDLSGPIKLEVIDETTRQTLLGRTVSRKGELQTVSSKLRFQTPGVHHLKFQLMTTDGEFSTNIRKSVRARKARQHVLLISDVLAPIVTMLQRSLPDSLFSVETLVKSKQGGFIPNQDPQSLTTPDLIILVDQGALAIDEASKQLINRVYADTIPTVIFNLNQSQLHTAIPGIQNLRNPAPGSFSPLLTSKGSGHPLGILASSGEQVGGGTDFWVSLPPLQGPSQLLWLEGVRIFDQIATPKALPIITLDEQRPLLIINGSGYWRWFFRPPGTAQFNSYWGKVVAYLLNRKYLKLVSLDVKTEAVHVGEPVSGFLHVRDVQGAPLDQGSVSVNQKFQEDGSSRNLELRRVSAGLYRAELYTAEKGHFSLTGRAEQQGRLWGRDSLSIRVEPYSAETQVTGVNQPLLQRMALKSGGRVIGPNDVAEVEFPTSEYTIWHEVVWSGLRSIWLLVVLIFVFGMEWAYRRRIGLM